ncbi:hypothetical protein BCR44DRAFT_1428972 [Catenaria anguillulae PL171]|uniref:Uncharacterized protein n=1 Tax=Catenaria anguillulae PL171 TaxID=765915 RepID=A0A1Y2HWY6_9FUNG|nr:hypothetical protein BCR44DRAFT_1428972 [Catenaria anguillulae PL171]
MQFCQTKEECANQRAKGFTAVRDHSAFFGRKDFCPHPIDICKPDLIYIHPICMGGRDNKINSIKSFGAWFMSDERAIGYYCAQKDKYGFAECPQVPKGLLEGFAVGEEPRLSCAGTKAMLTNAENN